MSAPIFQKATKTTSKLRLALIGPSGSGKTFTALALATELARGMGQRIALIDSERGSAAKYADTFDFDAVELSSHHPDQYVDAIHAAEAAGYGVLVVDSMSHAWAGREGVLEQVDAESVRSRGNKFAAWQKGTPLQNHFIDAVIGARLHVIATMRSKTEWVLEDNAKGKKEPRKVGTAPVQRDGVEYEFDVVGLLDHEHTLHIDKTRCVDLDGKSFRKAGADLAGILAGWLGRGVAPTTEAPRLAVVPPSGTAADPKAAHTARVTAVKARIDAARATIGSGRVHALVGDLAGRRLVEVEQAADTLEAAIEADARAAEDDDAPFDDAPPPDPTPTSASPKVDEPATAPTKTVADAGLRQWWSDLQRTGWGSEAARTLVAELCPGRGTRDLTPEERSRVLAAAIERGAPAADATGARSVLDEARGVAREAADAAAEDLEAHRERARQAGRGR